MHWHWLGWEAVKRLRELLSRAGQAGWHGPVRTVLRRLAEMEREESVYAEELALFLEDLVSEARPAADAVVAAFTGDASLAVAAASRERLRRVLVAALRARARGRGPEALSDVVAAIESMGASGAALAEALAEAARDEPDAARSLVVLAARGRRGALAALGAALEGPPWSGASLRAAAAALAEELGVPLGDAVRLVEEQSVAGLARLITGLHDAPRSLLVALLSRGYAGLVDVATPGLALEAVHRPGRPSPASATTIGEVEPGGLSGDGWVAAALIAGDRLVVAGSGGVESLEAPRGARPPVAASRHGVAVAVDTGSSWMVYLSLGGGKAWAELPGEPAALAIAPWGLAALVKEGGGSLLAVYRLDGASLEEAYTAELPGDPVAVAAGPRPLEAAAATREALLGRLHVASHSLGVKGYRLDSTPLTVVWSPHLGPIAVTSDHVYMPGPGRRLGLLAEASAAAPAAGGLYLLVAPRGGGLPLALVDPASGSVEELRGGPTGPIDALALAGGSQLLLAVSKGKLHVYPLECREPCPPAGGASHGLEHPGCEEACKAYREGKGPYGYVARLIGEGRHLEALAASALLASRDSWSPPSRSLVNAALLGLRPRLLEASEEKGPNAVAEELLRALREAQGKPPGEAASLVASRLGLPVAPGKQAPATPGAGANRPSPATAPPAAAAGRGDPVEAVLSVRLEGLAGGPQCRGGTVEAVLAPLEPREFEGRYECCLLGCGGYGCVYRCSGPRGLVAVKAPRGLDPWEAASATVPEGLAKRLEAEARALMRLRHPNIVRLLGHGRGAPLLVYEYASQGSLAWQLLRGWRPGLREALIVAVHVGDALRYVHSRGIVHGDVKPSNVLFSGGAAKLGDFSSATMLLSAATAASVAGTPGWRAPEQVYLDLRRKAHERGLENRIDVYQLGNLILYMLTGEALDGEEAAAQGPWKALDKVPVKGVRRILAEMLVPEPWRRPSMEEAVKKLAEEALKAVKGES